MKYPTYAEEIAITKFAPGDSISMLAKKIEFDFGFPLFVPVWPLCVKYVSFFEQLSGQLTPIIKSFSKKDIYETFDFRPKERDVFCKGETYEYNQNVLFKNMYFDSDYTMRFHYEEKIVKFRDNRYYGEFYKMHKDGYAYGILSVELKKKPENSSDIWIRWKSNLPDFEYIEPDDELDLKPEDITFEICEHVPEEFIFEVYSKKSDKFDCNEWKAFINKATDNPKKRKRRRRRNEFIYHIADDCEYPDTTFTICFDEEITDALKDKVTQEFIGFQEYWDSMHSFGIHDIMLADDLKEFYDENAIAELNATGAVKVLVDFGSCDPIIIENLIDWLETSELNIIKMLIE